MAATMKPYRIASEDDTCLMIHHDGEDRPFKVAKKGLSKATLERIQRFAQGGEVQPEEEVEPEPLTPAPEPQKAAPPPAPAKTQPPDQAPAAKPSAFQDAIRAAGTGGAPVELQAPDGTLARIGNWVSRTLGEMSAHQTKQNQEQTERDRAQQRTTDANMGAAMAGPAQALQEMSAHQTGMNQYLTDRDRAQQAATARTMGEAIGGISIPQGPRGAEMAELQRRGLVAPPAPPPAVGGPPALGGPDVQEPSAEQLAGLGITNTQGPSGELQTRVAGAPPPTPGAVAPGVIDVHAAPGGQAPFQPDPNTELAVQGINEQAQAAADLAAKKVEIQDRWIAARQALADRADKMLAEHRARGDQLFRDVLDAKIDPNRHWQGMGVAGKVSSVIGMILGGLGASGTGGRNLAVELLERNIGQDLEAQRAELGKKQNLLSHHLQAGRDLQSALELARADKRDMFAAELERAAMANGGPEALARAKILSGQARQQSELARREVALKELGAQMAMAAKMKAGMEDMTERAVQLPTGGVIVARSKEAAEKAAGLVGDYFKARAALDELVAFRKKFGSEKIPGEELAAASVIALRLQSAIRKEGGFGALDAGSSAFLDKLVSGDPGAYGHQLARYQALGRDMERSFQYGLRPLLQVGTTQTSKTPGLRKE